MLTTLLTPAFVPTVTDTALLFQPQQFAPQGFVPAPVLVPASDTVIRFATPLWADIAFLRYNLCGGAGTEKREYPPEPPAPAPRTESDRVREQEPFRHWSNKDKIRVPSDW